MDNARKSFHQTLEEIRQEMVQMAALVTEGIPRATEALLSGERRVFPLSSVLDGFHVTGFWAAMLGALIYSVLGLLIDRLVAQLFPE